MKTILVLSAVFVAVFASTPEFINWKNVKQADFKLKKLIPSIEGRILKGNVAQPHQFPYHVELYANHVEDQNEGRAMISCGGSLISREFVLTAARCVFGQSVANVTLGATDLIQDYNKTVVVSSKTFFIHRDYHSKTKLNDIALVKLPTPIELNELVQTIQLPQRSLLQSKLEGHMAVVTGWGQLSDDYDYSSQLHYTNLRVLPQSKCEVIYQDFKDSQICVSGNVHSICNGDFGAPLVVEEGDGTNVAIGIASFISRVGCQQELPTVFTRVTSYLDWISEISGLPIRN